MRVRLTATLCIAAAFACTAPAGASTDAGSTPLRVEIFGVDSIEFVVTHPAEDVNGRGRRFLGTGDLVLSDGSSVPLEVKIKRNRKGTRDKIRVRTPRGVDGPKFKMVWKLSGVAGEPVGSPRIQRLKTDDGLRTRDARRASFGVGRRIDAPVAAFFDTARETVALVHEDGSRIVAGVDHVQFTNVAGESSFLRFGDDGFPESIESGGSVVRFTGWTRETVDLAVVTASGEIDVVRDVAVDGDAFDALLTFRATLPAKRAAATTTSPLEGLSYVLRGAGLTIDTVACLAGIAAGPAGWLTTTVTCGSAILQVVSLIKENDPSWAFGLGATGAALDTAGLLGHPCVASGSRAAWIECGFRLVSDSLELYLGSRDREDAISDDVRLALDALNSGGGEVQVTLRWSNDADLDLHVVDPLGEEIWYSNATSTSGGFLDVDDTDGFGPENVFWEFGAPRGRYVVRVVHFSGDAPVDFTVLVSHSGSSTPISGRIEFEGDDTVVTEFVVN